MTVNRGLVIVTREGLAAMLGFGPDALVSGVAWDAVGDQLVVSIDHHTMPKHTEGMPLLKVSPPLKINQPTMCDDAVEIVTLKEAR